MPSDFLKFKVSLLRRFEAINDSKLVNAKNTDAFSVRYLKGYSRNNDGETFEVALTKAVLDVARYDGKKSAHEIVDRFSDGEEALTAKRALNYDLDQKGKPYKNHCDHFLFGAPLIHEGWSKRKRGCYHDVLKEFGVILPFDKEDMLSLLGAVDATYERRKVSNFSSLSDFIWDFVSRTWPLFDTSVLHIPLSYFAFDTKVSASKMRHHLDLMAGYGFERLLGRLIVLQATCGVANAKKAVLAGNVLELCEYDPDQIANLYSFLQGEKVAIAYEDLKLIGKGNPIERATYLAAYLAKASEPFQLITRISEVYCIDPSVLGLIQWDKYSDLIRKGIRYSSPELVGMAAILSEGGMLDRSPDFKALYVPTAANTHLLTYAGYARFELKLTPHQFFASFAKLPINVQQSVFMFLLKPGVMDSIANIFPSTSKLLTKLERDDAINALSLKLDCISYLSQRGLLKQNILGPIEEATRQRLRQVKYETEVSSGRIRLNSTLLCEEIANFSLEKYERPTLSLLPSDDQGERLRRVLLEQANASFAEDLADHICFNNRMAFDYLLSHLRHNFLRFKLESTIDDAFRHYVDASLTPFKKCMEEPLDRYCKTWLTISKPRSFYTELRQEIFNSLSKYDLEEIDDLRSFSDEIYEISKERFSRLLDACKAVWTYQVRNEVVDVVSKQLYASPFSKNTEISEALVGGLENAFSNSEGWLSINENPIREKFELKELFIFEATNFSTAKTRRRPFEVQCFSQPNGIGRAKLVSKDVLISGELFEPMVQLVHNLIENAFKHSFLPIAATSISVEIIDLGEGRTRVDFRNNFLSSKIDQVYECIASFKRKLADAKCEVDGEKLNAPTQTGGSGIKRIFFELYGLVGDDFFLDASEREVRKGTFLVTCIFPNSRKSVDG